MRVIEASKESWGLQPVGNGYQVVVKRMDGGIELHANPVIIKLAEDVLIRVEPMALKASIMKSSCRKAKRIGNYDELLKKVILYLVVDEEPYRGKAIDSYTHWMKSLSDDKSIVPTFDIIKVNTFSYDGRIGIASTR